jgi:PAS domain S-box-containing protein
MRQPTRRAVVPAARGSSEERLRLLLDSMPDYAIFMIGPQGMVLTWNDGATRIFGHRPQEIIGQRFSHLYPTRAIAVGAPPDDLDQARASERHEGEGWRVRKDGTVFWASFVITELRDREGRPRGFGVVTREMGDRRRTDDRLVAEVSLAATRTARAGVGTAPVRDVSARPTDLGGRGGGRAVPSDVVRTFVCDVCGARIGFENIKCLTCGSPLAYSQTARRVVVVRADAQGRPEFRYDAGGPAEYPCANQVIAECNWLAPEGSPNGLCLSCRLTRTRPNDADTEAMAAFVRTEGAKRRLVHQLLDLGLPVVSWMDDAQNGLAVDLLSSREQPVTTGHADGVITLDLAEGDDPHRESMRVSLREAYRTLLGHLRHESGHYYWPSLAGGPDQVEAFRALFGDERLSYQGAVDRHYAQGPPVGWEQNYVSAYATMHPWEDWAETFAHYLHLRDLLQTAQAFGLAVRRRVEDGAGAGELDTFADLDAVGAQADVTQLVDRWLPLSYGLNAVNRSMGKPDLYPFVLTPAVIAKLNAVHRAVHRMVAEPRPPVRH